MRAKVQPEKYTITLWDYTPSSAEREEIKRLLAELKRVEQERDMLKKVVTSACF